MSEAKSSEVKSPEPWLSGTLTEVPAVQRAVLHALELARLDIERWCGSLSDEEINASPSGLSPVSFHVRHIPGSLDRLLTYAEGRQLSDDQLAAYKSESSPGGDRKSLFANLNSALARSADRVRAFQSADLQTARGVGRKQLPTTVGGLLVHIAEHTQRHVGQAVVTAKLLIAQRQRN